MSGVSPVSDTALFVVVNVMSLNGWTPWSLSDCLVPSCYLAGALLDLLDFEC